LVILNTLEGRVQSEVERLDVRQIKKRKKNRRKLHLQTLYNSHSTCNVWQSV